MPHRSSCSRPSRWAVRLAALLALAGSAATCWHPWDDYEALAGDDDDDGAGGSTSAVCRELCAGYRFCIGPDPDCELRCEPQVVNCSTVELQVLGECIDELELCDHPAQAETLWTVCLIGVDCYTQQ